MGDDEVVSHIQSSQTVYRNASSVSASYMPVSYNPSAYLRHSSVERLAPLLLSWQTEKPLGILYLNIYLVCFRTLYIFSVLVPISCLLLTDLRRSSQRLYHKLEVLCQPSAHGSVEAMSSVIHISVSVHHSLHKGESLFYSAPLVAGRNKLVV